MLDFLGAGIIMEYLREDGTLLSSKDLLKICVKMGVSRSAQTLRQESDTHFWDFITERADAHLFHSSLMQVGVGSREG